MSFIEGKKISHIIYQVRSDSQVAQYLAALKDFDFTTYLHSALSAYYSALICVKLGMSLTNSITVTKGAALHDIGKMYVPLRILRKPTFLSKDEYKIVKSHVDRSVFDIDTDDQVKDIIYMHHERLNGAGYPLGLRSDSIPLSVRIVSVADAFAAMTEERTYKQSISPCMALSQLAIDDGYDLSVVNALINASDHLGKIPDQI